MTITISGFPTTYGLVDSFKTGISTGATVTNNGSQKSIVSFANEATAITLKNVLTIAGKTVYEYDISMLVDYIQALQGNATNLKLHIIDGTFGLGNAITSNPMINRDSKDPTKIVQSILTYQSSQLDFARAERKTSIKASFNVDLKNKVPKELIDALLFSITYKDILNEIPVYIEKTYETYKANLIRTYNLDPNNLQVDRFAGNNSDLEFLTTDKNSYIDIAKDRMNALLFDALKDPAQIIGLPSGNISMATLTVNGLFKNLGSTKLVPNIAGNKTFDTVRSSLIDLTNQTLNNDKTITDNDFVTIPIVRNSKRKTVKETIAIPGELIKYDDFILVFEVTDSTGLTVQMKQLNVRHSFMSTLVSVPMLPPKLITYPKGGVGKNIIDIQQADRLGAAVKIYRKEMSRTFGAGGSSDFVLVGDMSMRFGLQPQRFVDQGFISSNPVIYRVTCVSRFGVEAPTFSSVVIQSPKGKLDRSSGASNKQRFANIYSMFSKTDNNQLKILVKDIPVGVISFNITRKDLGNSSKEIVKFVSNYSVASQAGGSKVYTFIDNTVQNNKIYEYRVGMLYKDGTYKFAKQSHVIQYKVVQNNIMNTSFSVPKVSLISGDIWNVTFDVKKETTLNDQNLLKKFLEDQGYANLYINELLQENQKNKLQNLFATEVYRINTSTSEVEYYGIMKTEVFDESLIGPVAGVKALDKGTYIYRFITYSRAPNTMFTDQPVQATYRQKTYTYSPAKFKNSLTLESGTIVSDDALKRNHSNNKWTLGDVVDIDNIAITIPDAMPSIENVNLFNSMNNRNVVEWEVKGNRKKIDYFVINRKINNSTEVRGVVHNLSDKTRFSYVDIYDNNRPTQNLHGNISYIINAIYYDGSVGPVKLTNSVII